VRAAGPLDWPSRYKAEGLVKGRGWCLGYCIIGCQVRAGVPCGIQEDARGISLIGTLDKRGGEGAGRERACVGACPA